MTDTLQPLDIHEQPRTYEMQQLSSGLSVPVDTMPRLEMAVGLVVWNESRPARVERFKSYITETLEMLNKYYGSNGGLYVTLDGCTDNGETGRIAQEYGAHVLTNLDGENSTRGGSYPVFMESVDSEKIVILDGDGAYEAEDAVKMDDTASKGNFDIVIAKRGINDHASLVRRFGHYGVNALCDVFATTDASDSQAGAKFLTEKAADIIVPKITGKRWGVDREIGYIAKLEGLRTGEYNTNIRQSEDDDSSVKVFTDTLEQISDAAEMRLVHDPKGSRVKTKAAQFFIPAAQKIKPVAVHLDGKLKQREDIRRAA